MMSDQDLNDQFHLLWEMLLKLSDDLDKLKAELQARLPKGDSK